MGCIVYQNTPKRETDSVSLSRLCGRNSQCSAHSRERLHEIREEIIRVFDAHRDPHQVCRQRSLPTGNGRVRHGAGQSDGGMHAAKTHGDAEELALLDDSLGQFHVSSLKADQQAGSAGLLFMKRSAGVLFQSGKVNVRHVWMVRQEARDVGCVVLLPFHTQPQGLEPTE